MPRSALAALSAFKRPRLKLERKVAVMDALERFFGRKVDGDRNDPMAFLDEYAAVMNRYVKIEVRNRFKGGCYGWRMASTASMRRSGEKLGQVDCLIRSQLS